MGQEDRKVRVLLVDDHAHGREGMRTIIDMDAMFELVGEAGNGQEAVEKAGSCSPDLILMDINMPQMNGLEATQLIKTRHPSIKIVMVTVSDDITHLFEAIKRGAQGYLLKNLNPGAWHEYLRAIALDEAPMSKELAYRILQEFSRQAAQAAAWKADRAVAAAELSPLSPREKEILERVALGASNRKIAEGLGLSEHTVKNHLKNILQKLQLDNRVQLARYALQQGMAGRET